MTDFSRVDVRDFLSALGVQTAGVSGENILMHCPLHGNDRHPSARMHLKTTLFICSTCHATGNAISFLAQLRGMTNAEARGHIDRRYGSGPTEAIGELEQEVKRNLTPIRATMPDGRVLPTESWVEFFMKSWRMNSEGRTSISYMRGRGFEREVLDDWEIGFDPISGRVAIPVRNVMGTLVGFKARTFGNKEPRYLILGDARRSDIPRYGFDPYHKSKHVYGLNRVPWMSKVVIVEGELNVVAMSQKTPHIFAVGVAGSEFSETQRALIVERCGSVVVYFDEDSAGVRGRQKAIEMLSPYMPVSVVVGAKGDAAELSAEEIEELVEGVVPALSITVVPI